MTRTFDQELDVLMAQIRAFGEEHMGFFFADFDEDDDVLDVRLVEYILLDLRNRNLAKRRPGWSQRELNGQNWYYRHPRDQNESASVSCLLSGNGEKVYMLRTFDDGMTTLHGSLDDAMDSAEIPRDLWYQKMDKEQGRGLLS